MKISDLPDGEIKVGLRVSGLKTNMGGTIVKIVPEDEDTDTAWIMWDNEDYPGGSFYGNNCQCELRDDLMPEKTRKFIENLSK
jgi:hypothetical protein